MTRTIAVLAAVLSVPTPSFAQQARAADANPVSRAIKTAWEGARGNITASAQQMPEADYAFKPTPTVRTFGAILAHIAGANYVFCSAARGEKAPHGEDAFEKSATTKAAILAALTESIAYCDKAYDTLTDRTAGQTIAMPFGGGDAARADALIGNTGHLLEHYGNLVTYFRIKGMVPPSSRQQ
jgi:uncharacterized damage-inducible protein DinB